MGELRALTVRPPWSWAIEHGGKTTENRTWQTHYRGLLAIHAAAVGSWDQDGEKDPRVRLAWRAWARQLPHPNVARAWPDRGSLHITFGAVVAVADLAGCHFDGSESCALSQCSISSWAAPGQWHWMLANVRALPKPVSCRGAQGLWRLPETVEAEVRAQLDGAPRHG